MKLIPLVTRREAAGILRVSHRTLEKWACIGGGPTYIRSGKRAMYHPDALTAWIEGRLYSHAHCNLYVGKDC